MARGFYQEQRKALRAIGKLGVNRLRKKLVKLNKVASGKTYDSIHEEFSFADRESSVSIISNESIVYIDQGRKPGGKFPPLNVIEDWITSKDIIFRGKNGKPLPLKVQAFLIGRKISVDGIKPTHIIADVFNRKSFINLIKRRLEKASEFDIRVRTATLAKQV